MVLRLVLKVKPDNQNKILTTIYTTALPITPSAQLLDISKIVKRSQINDTTDAPDSTVALEKNVFEKRDPINFTSFNPSRDDIR
ncbi:114_t:CDS:2 [Gigaspora margarita]|uniref:114_t:CDS:1 n=1 Tax=Gigaspora margarita TaxID=4874 RepID=A0ABN7UFP1_GIGMA|nr:114_t:CDS:2 [Gigaspora margarita]